MTKTWAWLCESRSFGKISETFQIFTNKFGEVKSGGNPRWLVYHHLYEQKQHNYYLPFRKKKFAKKLDFCSFRLTPNWKFGAEVFLLHLSYMAQFKDAVCVLLLFVFWSFFTAYSDFICFFCMSETFFSAKYLSDRFC